ncbi:unnamed protein product, partial [marine sediment metagenome]
CYRYIVRLNGMIIITDHKTGKQYTLNQWVYYTRNTKRTWNDYNGKQKRGLLLQFILLQVLPLFSI